MEITRIGNIKECWEFVSNSGPMQWVEGAISTVGCSRRCSQCRVPQAIRDTRNIKEDTMLMEVPSQGTWDGKPTTTGSYLPVAVFGDKNGVHVRYVHKTDPTRNYLVEGEDTTFNTLLNFALTEWTAGGGSS